MTVSTSQRVARNGALYFGSLAAPALAAVFLVPVTVHALGASRFGLLALAWALAEGAGIPIVMDRCLAIDHRQLLGD